MAVPRIFCRFRFVLNKDFSSFLKHSSYSILNERGLHIQVANYTAKTDSGQLVKNSTNNSKIRGQIPTSSDSDDQSDSDSDVDDNVSVEYHGGLPRITVPLPSRRERCSFTLKPISNTVGEFLEMLKKEDKGIDRVVCKLLNGTRIASSNSIETLLEENFILIINDNRYTVKTPKPERLSGEEIQRLNDVKNLVSKLYEALHIQEHQCNKEKELLTQLETLQQEVQPLENVCNEVQLVAHRKSNRLAWVGLGLMAMQFGVLARLTWWEYSWDIMEPVTYFVTYGTTMACYAYYVLTKEEYVLTDVRNRQHLLVIHQKAKKLGVDLNRYNHLKDEIAKIENKLRKLKNPLKLHIPPKPASGSAQDGVQAGAISEVPKALNENK